MKPIASLLPLVLLVACASAVADDFTVEDDGLRPLPTTADAAIRRDNSFDGYKACRLIGKAADLTGGNHALGFIATTADGCAWGAALGPIWVVHETHGQAEVVFAGGGYSLTLGRQSQNGLRHIAVSAGTAGWYSESLWKFDGKHYVKVRQKNVAPAR